jgi:glycosyltransferase 2 family protein
VPGATGGDVVKAWYAARRLGAGTRAVVTVVVDRFLGLFGLVLLAGIALLAAPSDAAYATARTLVVVCLVGGLVVGAVLLSRRLRRATGLARLARRLPFAHLLAEADEALRLYRHRPRTIAATLLLSLANHAGSVVAAWLLAHAIGLHDLGLTPLLVVVPLASLAGAVPLLPGGWGVGEMAYAFLLAPFGVAPTEAVGLSVLLRLLNVAVSLPGGLLWVAWREGPSQAALEQEVEREAREQAELARSAAAGETP